MKKFEKIMDWATLVVFILCPISSLFLENYQLMLWQIMTLMWFGLAWARKNQIQEIMKEISEYLGKEKSEHTDKMEQ